MQQWIEEYWEALGGIEGSTLSVTFDRLEGEVTLRRGYLSNREKVCNILAMGYDPDMEPERKAKKTKYYFCVAAEKTTVDLRKRWQGRGTCPFEPISEGRIENERRRWKTGTVQVPYHERREPRELHRTNVGET